MTNRYLLGFVPYQKTKNQTVTKAIKLGEKVPSKLQIEINLNYKIFLKLEVIDQKYCN